MIQGGVQKVEPNIATKTPKLASGNLMVFNGISSYLMELYSDSMGY